ncbi:hypothetical protein GGH94_005722 [Coemansia aciculifera]|uniref:Hyaluronan/mRNA-binding protein domain-containing protein n=1 Tax=Coemansia aciculifera TaxID=417176 RepID=A0A9W8M411_9FUNG|nr:hypothetical protein GGH94_005722 [Coemansia aciculifera]KAJ2872898.1 hypothetical protein GGH93_003650 [Coemansia aciculifera]
MSVVSTNPFALLPDDAADSFVNVVPGKAAAKQAPKKVVPVTPAADRATPSERASRGTGYAPRGARRTVGTTRAPGAAIVDSAPAYEPREKDHSRPVHQSQRGRGSARGRGRQFDRHSGTGLVDSEKKEKQGWLGSEKDLVTDGAEATQEAKKDQEGVAAAPVVKEEPEEVIKTLDDYMKERESASVDTKRTLRKANEARVDQSQLKGQVALDKKDEDFFAPIATQKSRKQKERKEKVFVDIEQRFADESSRRGAFRGGPRGGAGGPQNRGGRGAFAANRGGNRVNINDESAFPSL